MSKNSNHNQPKPIKNIEVGKFYFIHDGSKTGHPGYVVWKDDEKNLYAAIKFGTTKNDDNEVLLNRINPIKRNFIYKRLFVGRRKDFSKDELCDFYITDEIIEKFVKIRQNNLKFSKNVSKAQKHFLNRNKNVLLVDIKK